MTKRGRFYVQYDMSGGAEALAIAETRGKRGAEGDIWFARFGFAPGL